MSVMHRSRTTKDKRRRAVRVVHPRQWALWSIRPQFRAFILAVDAAAIAAIALTATIVPIGRADFVWFAILAAASMAHQEANRRIERLRELAAEGTQYVDLKSIWTFAGLLLLPPPLVAALIVITYVHSWWGLGQRILPHRWTFSAAMIVLASTAGGAVLAIAFPGSYPGLPHGWIGIAVVAAAAVARWLVNSLLVLVALMLIDPDRTLAGALRDVFGEPLDDAIEFASLSIGAGVALVLVVDAPWLLVGVIPLWLLHRGLMMRQFEHAARHDTTTGLYNGAFWREVAVKELERANRLGERAGLLLVHVDEFDAITSGHGAVAGDRVLKQVAGALTGQVREGDHVARLAGEEFVVLVSDVATRGELAKLAEDIRSAVRGLAVEVDGPAPLTGLTVSVGGALYPDSGRTLDELMLTVDNAMFAAKTYVRDQIRLVGAEKRRP